MKLILNLIGVGIVSAFVMSISNVNFVDAVTYSMLLFIFVDKYCD